MNAFQQKVNETVAPIHTPAMPYTPRMRGTPTTSQRESTPSSTPHLLRVSPQLMCQLHGSRTACHRSPLDQTSRQLMKACTTRRCHERRPSVGDLSVDTPAIDCIPCT